MFGLLFRILLIGLVIYLIIGLATGWYGRICAYYCWMWPDVVLLP